MARRGRGLVRRLGIGLAAVGVGAACSTGGAKKSLFERHYERYLSEPHQKAMAIAGDLEGEWTFGYGSRFRSTGTAIDKAFEECDRRRKDLAVPAECRLYAVGNQVVEGNPELETRYRRE